MCVLTSSCDSLVLLSFLFLFFFLMLGRPPRSTLFPTRRSSDLGTLASIRKSFSFRSTPPKGVKRSPARRGRTTNAVGSRDRKSTRLNSSHTVISYAVFCLKKKKKLINTEKPPSSTESAQNESVC